jgi:hypothetical protein
MDLVSPEAAKISPLQSSGGSQYFRKFFNLNARMEAKPDWGKQSFC